MSPTSIVQVTEKSSSQKQDTATPVFESDEMVTLVPY